MTIGEGQLKYIAFVLILLIFFGFSSHNLFAREITIELPELKSGKSLWQNISEKTKSLFQKLKIGKGENGPISFLKNIGKSIIDYCMSLEIKEWFKNYWTMLNIYLDKEIRIE